jgi:hypothetical protein
MNSLPAAAFALDSLLLLASGILALAAGVLLWRARWQRFAIALSIALALGMIAQLLNPL